MPSATKTKTSTTTLAPTHVKIVRADDGGPINAIVDRGHRKPTGVFTSQKNGRDLPWESVHESHFMWMSEIDWRVSSFLAQPFRFEFYFGGGKKMTYTPDLERHLDASVEIIEVKKEQAEIAKDPHYARKISLARQVCERKGWKFRVITAAKHIEGTRLFENARLVKLDRFTTIDAEDKIRLGDAMHLGGGMLSYGEAVAALSRRDDPWDLDGTARLHSLIVRRHVRVDLTKRISSDLPVFLMQ